MSNDKVVEALLAAAPQQAAEPVAITKDSDDLYTGWLSWTGKELPPGTKLYTHPQPAQDAKLPSDEDFRLHLGELTPAELRVAQAAFRYAMAKESGR